MITLTCAVCEKQFKVSPYYAKRGQKCCSRTCGHALREKAVPWNKGLKGIHLSPKTEWKSGHVPQGSVLFEKGHVPWNYGKNEGRAAWFYKDRELEYKALHKRINRKLRDVYNCQWCGAGGVLHCANLSGNYLEDLDDWAKVCVSCHYKYDYARAN